MNTYRSSLIVLFTILLLSPPAKSALILNSDGLVEQITNIEANGTIYNATFHDGTCAELFSGCDEPYDFIFTSETQSLAAGTAMLEQLNAFGAPLLAAGSLNGEPGGVGCSLIGSCEYLIPFEFVGPETVLLTVVQNLTGDSPDSIFGNGLHTTQFDSSDFEFYTYAVFTATAVPATSSFHLFLGGMALLGIATRTRRKRFQQRNRHPTKNRSSRPS